MSNSYKICQLFTSVRYFTDPFFKGIESESQIMVQVKVEGGILEGEKINNEYGGSYYSFKGIPYAAPPVGNLRFKAPQSVRPWEGIRNAKEFGPVCIQFDSLINKKPLGEEDCLYLNVYTPNTTPKQLYPVMVWIHGGGFVCGSGNDDVYGPEFLIQQNIILVTFNYRLEALGFLCLHTKEIPGNAGMKDQIALLRWVQKNIRNFGGDPDNVTIFGESAGSGSVSFHLISPLSEGLFKRAILQSGAVTNWWANDMRPRERALNLAKKLGFYSNDDKELVEFFKSVPVESLINLELPVTMYEGFKENTNLYFSIVSEKDFGDEERFFHGEYNSYSLTMHKNVDIIIGYTEHEGVLGLYTKFDITNMINQANYYSEFFVPKWITYKCTIDEQIDIGNKVKNFYFGDDAVTMKNINQLLKYLSFDIITYGVITFARLIAANNEGNVYLYKFTCKSKRNMFSAIFGADKVLHDINVVAHADDLAYLFPIKTIIQEININSKEYHMIQNMTKLWSNFAKHGNPTPDAYLGAKWESYDIEKQNYLDIGENLIIKSYPEKEEIDFWDDIYRRLYPHFVI